MTALTKWTTAGSWVDAFAAADFNALANGSGILSTATAIANGAGDPYLDLSFRMVTSTMSPVAGGGLDFFILPLLDDGTTYPDSANGTTVTDQPTATYFVGRMVFRAKATVIQNGMLRGILAPNGTYKWYVINNCGVALPSSATNMTCKQRLYGENLNG